MKNGAPVFAEYSAENGHPTATGVSEPLCTGKARYGHGRGTCQWGTPALGEPERQEPHVDHAALLPGRDRGEAVGGGGGTPTAIVVDSNNANNDARRAKVEYTGTWTSRPATPGYYGTDYRWAATEQSLGAGDVLVPPRRPPRRARSMRGGSPAPIARRRRRSSSTTPPAPSSAASRRTSRPAGAQWNALGTFAFKAGWNRVVLSRWQAPGSVVIADAIRVR